MNIIIITLRKRTIDNNHTANFEQTEILAKERNYKATCILELI